jgi:hypothetical protein
MHKGIPTPDLSPLARNKERAKCVQLVTSLATRHTHLANSLFLARGEGSGVRMSEWGHGARGIQCKTATAHNNVHSFSQHLCFFIQISMAKEICSEYRHADH